LWASANTPRGGIFEFTLPANQSSEYLAGFGAPFSANQQGTDDGVDARYNAPAGEDKPEQRQ
jgi:hypothetical protein